MREKTGISMISLIVTILVTILLASIAIETGSQYLKKSKEKDKDTFIGVMSLVVSQRGEDAFVDSVAHPYIGYRIPDSIVFDAVFAPKIHHSVGPFDNYIWYVLDADAASRLGVQDADQYLGTFTADTTIKKTVALVDYRHGNVILIEASSSEVSGLELT